MTVKLQIAHFSAAVIEHLNVLHWRRRYISGSQIYCQVGASSAAKYKLVSLTGAFGKQGII